MEEDSRQEAERSVKDRVWFHVYFGYHNQTPNEDRNKSKEEKKIDLSNILDMETENDWVRDG